MTEALSVLKHQSCPVTYIQVDICDLAALRLVFQRITTSPEFASARISNLVHTAGVIQDATLSAVTPSAFEQVICPKILGAWNLHVLSEELGLNATLEQFVLLSSIRYEFIFRP